MTKATSPANPTATYAELRSRLNHADYHGRVSLAARLLEDRDWVRDPAGGGGDSSTAVDRLEDNCFPDVCGPWYGLTTLLQLLQKFPKADQWVAKKNNLKAMVAELQADRKPRKAEAKPNPAANRTPTVQSKVETFLKASPAAAVQAYEKEAKQAERATNELLELREENEALRKENAALRRENERMKSYIDRIKKIAV